MQMDKSVRSFFGSFFCRSEKARMRPTGSPLALRMGSTPPPGTGHNRSRVSERETRVTGLEDIQDPGFAGLEAARGQNLFSRTRGYAGEAWFAAW